MSTSTDWPSVEVVIPTRGNRPEMLAQAIESVRSQHYAGEVGTAVVFDHVETDSDIVASGVVPVRVLTNHRSQGLAGTRNAGIETSSAELIAFLDDDDFWLPGKLAAQVSRLTQSGADFATTAMRVDFRGTRSDRLAGSDTVTHEQLVASRMAMLHSSTFLARRDALVDIGMVDESAPLGQNEDWDLLLRFSRRAPIVHVDEPLVSVRWGSTSMFATAWESKIAGLHWIISQHPEIKQSRVGYARVLGQIAFAQAALRNRRVAMKSAIRASRTRWQEPRGYLAMAAASGVSPSLILKVLHQRGHGI